MNIIQYNTGRWTQEQRVSRTHLNICGYLIISQTSLRFSCHSLYLSFKLSMLTIFSSNWNDIETNKKRRRRRRRREKQKEEKKKKKRRRRRVFHYDYNCFFFLFVVAAVSAFASAMFLLHPPIDVIARFFRFSLSLTASKRHPLKHMFSES